MYMCSCSFFLLLLPSCLSSFMYSTYSIITHNTVHTHFHQRMIDSMIWVIQDAVCTFSIVFIHQTTPSSPNLPPAAVTGRNDASGCCPLAKSSPLLCFFASSCFMGGCCVLSKSVSAFA